MAQDAVTELVKAFIKHNLSGLIVRYDERTALRTLNSNDGYATIFNIGNSTIEMWLLHNGNLLSRIAIVNSKDPNLEAELCSLVADIAIDYADSKHEWPDELPSNYETFSPADWWKYGANPCI